MAPKQRISKKVAAPYVKPEARKKNGTPPASPVYVPSYEDYNKFQEVCAFYNVASTEDHKSKLEVREKNELLNEVSIPLNQSYTKILRFGMDVYNNFKPCLKVVKSGLNLGIRFTLPQIKMFLGVLDDMIEAQQHQEVGKYDLEEFLVHTTELKSVRFAPKKDDDKFQLYLGLTSLQTIKRMNSYFTTQMENLEKCDFQFYEYLEDVVNLIDKQKKESATYEDFTEILDRKYNDNNTLYELVHKFPHFMNCTVKEYMESNHDRFLYK